MLKVKVQDEKACPAVAKAGFGMGFQHWVSALKVSMQGLQQDYDAVVGTSTKPIDGWSALPLLGCFVWQGICALEMLGGGKSTPSSLDLLAGIRHRYHIRAGVTLILDDGFDLMPLPLGCVPCQLQLHAPEDEPPAWAHGAAVGRLRRAKRLHICVAGQASLVSSPYLFALWPGASSFDATVCYTSAADSNLLWTAFVAASTTSCLCRSQSVALLQLWHASGLFRGL